MPVYEAKIKKLLDQHGTKNVKQLHDGGVVAEGYKPDRVYKRNGQVWIIEIEASTSRKGFIGGYLKAQKYFEDTDTGKGRLLFIISDKDKKLESVSKQITQYHNWLKDKEIKVHPTYLMYDTELGKMAKNDIEIFSKEFLEASIVIR